MKRALLEGVVRGVCLAALLLTPPLGWEIGKQVAHFVDPPELTLILR